jgi:hypothetical protein
MGLFMKERAHAQTEENLLISAAKTIGKAAGKIAAATGVQPAAAEPPRPKKKREKLAPKNKGRLPRRRKKARKKQQMAA